MSGVLLESFCERLELPEQAFESGVTLFVKSVDGVKDLEGKKEKKNISYGG
jgi:hypothetical protein